MRLGYNTNGLQNHRLGDAMRLLADHGYQAVALTPDVGHLDPFVCTAREVEQFGALLQQLGLQPVVETGARYLLSPTTKHEPTLMTRDRDERDRRLDFYRRCAAIARDLGAKVLSFWAGIDRTPGPDSANWLRDGVAQTCTIARAAGLTPALEPEPGMAVETVGQYSALRNTMGPYAPSLCLDVGHLYAVWEGEPAGVIAANGAHLRQVHLEDMARGTHEHLPPGQGDVDFKSVVKALSDVRYDGPVCVELSRHSHDAPAMVARWAGLWRQLTAGIER